LGIEELQKYGINCPKQGKFIINLSSKWCRSCKFLNDCLGRMKDAGLIEVEKLDIGDNNKLVKELKIYSVPALIFFKDGKLLDKNIKINEEISVNKGVLVGSYNGEILEDIINQM